MAKEQWEEETIERFREFLTLERGATFAISGRDMVVDPVTGENFDYQLTSGSGEKIAVEIFRLVERGSDLARQKVWSQVVDLLKQELTSQGIRGYRIALPETHIPLREVGSYARQAATKIVAALEGNPEASKFTASGMTFHRIEEYESVSFSWGGEARSVNPHGTAESVFRDKLPKKNKQVGVSDHERIVLVTNWAVIVGERDVTRALSRIEFEAFQNIDRMFFEARDHQFFQVFDRKIYEAILQKTIRAVGDPSLLLRYVGHQLAEKKQEAYDFIRAAAQETGSIEWLSDNGAKESLVLYAQDLAQEGRTDEAMWVIRQLKDDLDPDPLGRNSSDDSEGEHNEHSRIMNGDEVNGITTVRGHLCWLIAKVIARNKPEYYGELIEVLDEYLSEQNLYIRAQALIPLTDLAVRIRAIRNHDGSPFEWDRAGRDHVKALAFRTLDENAKHPRVLQMLLHVFDHMRGISEEEAMTVLRTFLATGADYILHDMAVLVIYFALFRKHNFKEDAPFKAEEFIELLRQQIVSGSSAIRTSLAWHFWKCLTYKQLSLDEVREYLLMFWTHKYDQGLASTFDLIFEELLRISPSDACEIFDQMMERLKEFANEHEGAMREVWISRGSELVAHFAKMPSRLLRVVNVLGDAWKKGALIHDLASILESYRFVDVSEREAVKMEFIGLYQEIKQLNPMFPDIEWTK
jgi:hypothetical protein